MSVTSRRCLITATSALALMLACPALASAPPAAKGTQATLTVTVVHAHKGGAKVDPKLAAIADYLTKSFKGYTGFKQVGDHRATLASKGKTSVKLPDGKTLTLAFQGVDKGFVKVYLELDGLKTTVDVRDGGLFFQAGRVYKGGILILAIGAKTGAASSLGAVDTTGA